MNDSQGFRRTQKTWQENAVQPLSWWLYSRHTQSREQQIKVIMTINAASVSRKCSLPNIHSWRPVTWLVGPHTSLKGDIHQKSRIIMFKTASLSTSDNFWWLISHQAHNQEQQINNHHIHSNTVQGRMHLTCTFPSCLFNIQMSANLKYESGKLLFGKKPSFNKTS